MQCAQSKPCYGKDSAKFGSWHRNGAKGEETLWGDSFPSSQIDSPQGFFASRLPRATPMGSVLDQFAGLDKQALGLWLDVTSRSVQADGPDLTARQTALMLTVYLEVGPHTVRSLAHKLGVGKPAIVRAIDTLGDAGLVTRIPDPRDRRSVFVIGTQNGASRLSTYAATIARTIADIANIDLRAAEPSFSARDHQLA
jgi:DNA-binding MarR family transcriptional regulator